jgi:CBS-domain-containing membrane protein
MEKARVDILPVINRQGRFTGTVSRSALTASLILSITEKLEAQ